MGNPKLANYRRTYKGYSVRVMCPECGRGGSHPLWSYQPRCISCDDVLMEPASNNEIVCTWQEAIDYIKSKEETKMGKQTDKEYKITVVIRCKGADVDEGVSTDDVARSLASCAVSAAVKGMMPIREATRVAAFCEYTNTVEADL